MPLPDWSNPFKLREQRAQLVEDRFNAVSSPGETVSIALRDGVTSNLRIYRPSRSVSPSQSPLIVLNFGGGFILGDNRQQAALAVTLVKLYSATVVLPTYRLAPEHKFPTAHNDIWDSLLWIVSHAAEVGSDATAGFVLGGISAGANISAALGQRWVDEQQRPTLSGLWLDIPAIFHSEHNVPEQYRELWLSREQNVDTLVINRETLKWTYAHFEPDGDSPLYSPLNSSHAEKHKNLRSLRVYFQVAGMDPLRDDGLIYERILRAAGVETMLDVYPGMPHGHAALFGFLKQGQRALKDTPKGFAWLLKQEVPSEEEVAGVVAAPGGA